MDVALYSRTITTYVYCIVELLPQMLYCIVKLLPQVLYCTVDDDDELMLNVLRCHETY